jgi:uncharacterized repeat protein (TIGR03803 family)
MKRSTQNINWIGAMDLWMMGAAISIAILLILVATQVQAQTGTVLHNFTGGDDGADPLAGVTFDQQGRIYGTALGGGSHGQGVVYRLVREGDGWVFSPIYNFGSQEHDGSNPQARVLFGPNGLLYGTTYQGGAEGYGTVFRLQPPATACKSFLCPWVETVLYSFTGGADGAYPQLGDLVFDQAGNIYGTTGIGGSGTGCGSFGCGVVFKLTRSGGGWTESVLWNFTGGNDGGVPLSGVIFDSVGNLYGTTSSGGNFAGTVYELSPTQSGWRETTLYSFTSNDYGNGAGGLIMDAQGDLFGITGDLQSGAAYELKPQNGSWSFSLLQSFTGLLFTGPLAAPTFDSRGNLYGPVPNGGSEEEGEIFKLTHAGDQWIYSQFYQFTGTGDLGVYPIGAVTFDANGNMYGTSDEGGTGQLGTVWEITP